MTSMPGVSVPLKSLLFVPGDSERKLGKAMTAGASALILDLEDSVPVDRIALARGMVRDFLVQHGDRTATQLWVRINALDTPLALHDLAEVVRGRPDGIVLPKVQSGRDVAVLDDYLTALEARDGIPAGSLGIIPVTGETPRAVLNANSYAGVSPRLCGLTWGAEDLATAVGASGNRAESGEFEFTFQLARSLCLLGAHAAGVQAIDTIAADFRDQARLEREVRSSRRAGFSGKLCIHPDQVAPVNAGYAPDASEIAHARAIVDAFARAGGAGAVQIEGRMIDKPHLTQAQRILALAGLRT